MVVEVEIEPGDNELPRLARSLNLSIPLGWGVEAYICSFMKYKRTTISNLALKQVTVLITIILLWNSFQRARNTPSKKI